MSGPTLYDVIDNLISAVVEMSAIVKDLNPGMTVTNQYIEDSLENARDQLEIIKQSLPSQGCDET